MVNSLFIPQRLIGRHEELQKVSQILAEDGDFLLVGAPGIGRRTLIRAAAQQVGARVLEIDCLRTTSANRFLRILADSITDAFSNPKELLFIERWSSQHPFVLEQNRSQRPQLVWHAASGKEWVLFQTLLALPQLLAEWLDCRIVIVFLNFSHIRSWDRSGKWEDYLQQEIQQQSRVSYALVSTLEENWVQYSSLHIISLAPLDDATMKSWLVPALAAEGLQFDAEGQALELFIKIVQGHLGDAIALARRIWLDRHALMNYQTSWYTKSSAVPNSGVSNSGLPNSGLNPVTGVGTSPIGVGSIGADGIIEAHHVHRSALALVEDLSVTFELLILLLPPSQVRVLESLALDPTDKPQSREYIQKHHLTRGGGLQGALASLEQKGLLYGPKYGYRIALPFLAFWLKQRLN